MPHRLHKAKWRQTGKSAGADGSGKGVCAGRDADAGAGTGADVATGRAKGSGAGGSTLCEEGAVRHALWNGLQPIAETDDNRNAEAEPEAELEIKSETEARGRVTPIYSPGVPSAYGDTLPRAPPPAPPSPPPPCVPRVPAGTSRWCAVRAAQEAGADCQPWCCRGCTGSPHACSGRSE